MIVLDTHVWVWWVHDDPRLSPSHKIAIARFEDKEIGVSVISCWEVAKLVEYGRIVLPFPLREWMKDALAYPGVTLLELTPDIVVESTQLPGTFHRGPADQMIVATARIQECPLLSSDEKILHYPHVETIE